MTATQHRSNSFHPTNTPLAIAAAALAFALAAGPATAPMAVAQNRAVAQDRAVLEEVVVTARKVSESLQDVAVAVTAFSGEQIDDMIMRDVREMEGLVPNVVIDAVSVAPAGASLYIRGVGTQEVERSFDPAVGVVIDGVPLSFVNGSMANTFDFAAIEILRGPQGTLFGRNTTGGVINITRTRPTGEFGLRYELTRGSEDLLDAKAVVNFPLGESLSGKLGFATQQEGSSRHNVTIDESVGQADETELTATFLFQPNEQFSVLFTYVDFEDNSDGVPLANRASLNGVANNPVNPRPDPPCLPPNNHCQGADIEDLTQDWYQRDLEFEWQSYTLNAEYDMGFGSLVGIWGSQQTDEAVPTDFDASPLNFFHTLRYQDSEQTTMELRFASSDELSEQFDFVAGIFYVDDKYQLDQKTSIAAYLGTTFGTKPFRPTLPDGSMGDWVGALFQDPYADHKRDAWAVFGELHYDIYDQITLTVGGRYTEEDKSYAGRNSVGGEPRGEVAGVDGALPFLQGFVEGSETDDFFIFGQPVWVQISTASGSESWKEFTPKLGVDYRINDDVLTYASYSEGFRSGGFNGRNQDPDNIGPFDPEFVKNLELGMKGDFLSQTLRVNVAAFVNKYDDKQEEVIEPDGLGGSNTVVRNASAVDIYGLEVEATWVVNENLVVNGNLGYLDAQYDKFRADLNGDGRVTDNSDLTLRRVPELTGGVNGTYSLPLGPGVLSAFASYRYTDEYWVEVRNDPRGLLEDRGVLDATIAYDMDLAGGNTFRVALWGRDLTDEVAYNSAVTIPGTIAFSGVGGGRQYGLRLSGSF